MATISTGGGRVLANIQVKTEKITVREDGRIHRQPQRNPNDLLITLRDADSQFFKHVSNADILREIVQMGVGTVKRAPQRQWDRNTGDPTGNKYFLLENVMPEDRLRIPPSFTFSHPNFGSVKMWLSHRFQIRRCWFCGDTHDAVCPVKEQIKTLQKEREDLKAQNNGVFQVKTYADSTLRYANQIAVASDIDSMSGASTGNLLNAVGVDEDSSDTPNVILVAGSKEIKSDLSPQDFLHSLEVIRTRVLDLQQKKNVAIIPPPVTVTGDFKTPEEEVREEYFNGHLQEMLTAGVQVWENPIKEYDEDNGMHPSPTQTVDLMKFVHAKTMEVWKTPFILPSADDAILKTVNKYHHVNSLYRYGCGACDGKDRNKWFNICDKCKDAASKNEDIGSKAKKMLHEIEEKVTSALPPLQTDSGDELKCNDCDVNFPDMRDLRDHFKESHPDKPLKFKRGKSSSTNNEERKDRRLQK